MIAELKPPVTAEVIVTDPELPLAILSEVGDALIEKPAVVPVTVRLTVVVSTVEPDVPVTVMLYVPAVVVEATVNVSDELPEPPLIVPDPNAAVTPVGRPDAVSATEEVNDPTGETAIVVLPLDPCATDTDVGDAEILKLDDVVVPPVNALIKPVFGLPQPVTRS